MWVLSTCHVTHSFSCLWCHRAIRMIAPRSLCVYVWMCVHVWALGEGNPVCEWMSLEYVLGVQGSVSVAKQMKAWESGNAAGFYGQGPAHYRGGRKNPSSSGEVWGKVYSLLVNNVLFILLHVTSKSSVWGTSICTSTDLFSEDPGPLPGTLDKWHPC